MTAPGDFERARLAELPPMLDGPNGRGCAAALGRAQDVEIATATTAVLMRYPPRTPADALDILGADSDIERFDGEPDGAAVPASGYHGRLAARWSTHKKKGAPQAIVDSLNGYGVTDAAIYQDFEGSFASGDWYSRFWVLLGPTLPWAPMLLGAWTLGRGTLGSSATLAEVKAVKRQVLKLKSAHSYPVRIVLDFGAVAASGLVPTLAGSCGGAEVDNAVYWHIGKLFGFDTSMPFTMGGFEV